MILSGSALAQKKLDELKPLIATGSQKPCIAVIKVGDDPASAIYVQRKMKVAASVGVTIDLHEFATTTTEALRDLIVTLNHDAQVTGILVQLPLPQTIDTETVIRTIDPTKDIDGFHPDNIAAYLNDQPVHEPVLVRALQWLLTETGANLRDASAVLLGKSDVFLKPLAHALEQRGIRTRWIKLEELKNPADTNTADIIIAAYGRAECIGAAYVKEGAIVLDIGINRRPDGTVVGDMCFDEVSKKAAWITPTPGGVGPVTIAALMWNAYELANYRAQFK